MGMDVEAYLRYGIVIDPEQHGERLGEAFENGAWTYLEKVVDELKLNDLEVHACGADSYMGYVVYAGKTFHAEWAQATLVPELPDVSEHLPALEQLRTHLGLEDVPIGWHLTALWF